MFEIQNCFRKRWPVTWNWWVFPCNKGIYSNYHRNKADYYQKRVRHIGSIWPEQQFQYIIMYLLQYYSYTKALPLTLHLRPEGFSLTNSCTSERPFFWINTILKGRSLPFPHSFTFMSSDLTIEGHVSFNVKAYLTWGFTVAIYEGLLLLDGQLFLEGACFGRGEGDLKILKYWFSTKHTCSVIGSSYKRETLFPELYKPFPIFDNFLNSSDHAREWSVHHERILLQSSVTSRWLGNPKPTGRVIKHIWFKLTTTNKIYHANWPKYLLLYFTRRLSVAEFIISALF